MSTPESLIRSLVRQAAQTHGIAYVEIPQQDGTLLFSLYDPREQTEFLARRIENIGYANVVSTRMEREKTENYETVFMNRVKCACDLVIERSQARKVA